jgi:cytochrome c-type biogenesis protein CcsB
MSLFWLRVSLVLYSIGLAHALYTVFTRRTRMFRVALGAISLGAVFHFVSIVEEAAKTQHFPATNFQQSVSLLAFSMTCVFLLAYWRYRFEALSVFAFPLVFMLTLAASGSTGPRLEDPILKSGWIYMHVILLFAGYAMLFITFAAGLMYILQERELKSKKPRALFHRLPPLQQLDDLAHKSLAIGFPLMTIGIVSGALWAAASDWNPRWPLDPKMALSFVTWLIYLGLVFSRWTAGWRGRRAAYFAIAGFAAAVVTWGANSTLHSFR